VKIGAFDVNEPIPQLNEPYAFAILRPWIDVNNVGSLLLNDLERQFGAEDLAQLARPGNFFDFTRYRPTVYLEEGVRRVSVPNAEIRYARREGTNDLVFLHLLEPHARSEVYVESVLRLLDILKVKKYCLLGSMYDIVPHTRPLIINGGAMGKETESDLKRSPAYPSNYQGPTTIVTLVTQRAPEIGINTLWFIVSLPQYAAVEEDYMGKLRLMELLNLLYNIPIDKKDFEKAMEQRSLMNEKVEKSQELKTIIPQLEAMYDVRVKRRDGERMPALSPEIERMLWEITEKDDIGKA